MRKTGSRGARFSDFCSGAAVLLTGLGFLTLAIIGLYSTCWIFMDFATNNNERVLFLADSVWVNLAVVAGALLLLILLLRMNITFLHVRILSGVMLLLTAALGIFWINIAKAAPYADSLSILKVAQNVAAGDYALLAGDRYFRVFPFQLGYLLYAEGFLRVFGADNLLSIAYGNVACVLLSYLAALKISRSLFPHPKVTFLTALLLGLCIQPVFLATFLYGTLPGLALSLWGAYFLIRFLQKGSMLSALAGALLLAAGVTLKMNYTLLVIADCIVLLLSAIRWRAWRPVFAAALVAALAFAAPRAVQRSYEARADTSFGAGTPQTAWLVAGFDESSTCSGWFNSYTTSVLEQNGYDQDATKAQIRADFQTRLQAFSGRPRYIASFWYAKIVSQWNEPAFQSVWSSAAGAHTGELSPFADSLCYGAGADGLNAYFNRLVEVVYVLFALSMAFLLFDRKARTEEMLLLPVTILGAALYHALFEAKSQYALPYLVMMLPYCAYAATRLSQRLWRKNNA